MGNGGEALRKYLFPVFIASVALLLLTGSYFFRDSREAMIAIVDAQVTAVSFEDPVVVSEIHVVAGQKVKKGQILLHVENPQLVLKISRYRSEIDMLIQELEAENTERQSKEMLLRSKQAHELAKEEGDLALTNLKLVEARYLSQQLATLGGDSISTELSLLLAKKESISNRLQFLKKAYRSELSAVKSQYVARKKILDTQLQLKKLELDKALSDRLSLIQYAGFDGTVGTVNVQLGELTSPFKKLITIYESKPSLIKAYLNERITYEVNVGDSVNVLSENRSYQTTGVVIEIGNRIAPFPEKIDIDPLTRNYGQEVFVRIPTENTFLNGEKVFVAPKPD